MDATTQRIYPMEGPEFPSTPSNAASSRGVPFTTNLPHGRPGVLLNSKQRRKIARRPLHDEWFKKTELQREQYHLSHPQPTHTIIYIPIGGRLIPYLLSPNGNKARRITEVQACRLRGLSAPVFAQEPVGELAEPAAEPAAAEPAAEEPAAAEPAEEPAAAETEAEAEANPLSERLAAEAEAKSATEAEAVAAKVAAVAKAAARAAVARARQGPA